MSVTDTPAPPMNMAKFEQFLGQFVQDIGAVMHGVTVIIGDKLGLYKAMADSIPVTSQQLADKTGCDERYIREWLASQAASKYVEYDAATQTYTLPQEHAFALISDEHPVFIPAGYYLAGSTYRDEEKFTEIFKSGKGLGWHEHHPDLFCGTLRFFKPTYMAHLIGDWIPSIPGLKEKLEAGAKVADIGCGLGASTILMAKTFPNSEFWGYDYHGPSIDDARKAAKEAGVEANCHFEVVNSKEFPRDGFDLICYFDCLHDMGDPVGAMAHTKGALKDDGIVLIVEPFAHDTLEENINPIGRIMYSASTMVCTPASRSQEVGLGLGAQAGESRLRKVANDGGFSQFRRANETPFNLVFEARK